MKFRLKNSFIAQFLLVQTKTMAYVYQRFCWQSIFFFSFWKLRESEQAVFVHNFHCCQRKYSTCNLVDPKTKHCHFAAIHLRTNSFNPLGFTRHSSFCCFSHLPKFSFYCEVVSSSSPNILFAASMKLFSKFRGVKTSFSFCIIFQTLK